jgi:hypothetical protein
MKLDAGLHVSLNGSTWYKLTDHNRQPIDFSVELIESQNRMANGSLRKYVIAQKNKISTSWLFLPTNPTELVDYNRGGSWIESFYKNNVGIPIYIKIIQSEIDSNLSNEVEPPVPGTVPNDLDFKSATYGSKIYQVFITNFSKSIRKRTPVSDYVDIDIEFTEI